MKNILSVILLSTGMHAVHAAASVGGDGATLDAMVQAYCDAHQCKPVECSERYQEFLGRWSGPFRAYDREMKGMRSYRNEVTYTADDCYIDEKTGETFIIGRRTDTYDAAAGLPGKVVHGLLITGRDKDDAPFLRTVDAEGTNSYQSVYRNVAASLSIWALPIPANEHQPAMTFTIIDGRDWSIAHTDRRNVTLTMESGRRGDPGHFEFVIVNGYHEKQ